MNEGGFNNFFSTEAGNFALEIKNAYKAINAPKTALLIEKALGLFPNDEFNDKLDERNKQLAKMDEMAFSGWEDLDELFFDEEQEEDIVALIVEYIRKHKEKFN
jgi:ADP-dependent phosphofructokinase/glucokinase